MRNGKALARRVVATFTMAAVASTMAPWASAQCGDSCGPACPICGPQYYSHPGQYGSQYGAGIHDRAKPRCIADGQCMPNRAVWGHYEQKWRRWPAAADGAGGGARRHLPPGLEKYDPPTPEQEDQTSPAPTISAPSGEELGTTTESGTTGFSATDGLLPGDVLLQPSVKEGNGPPVLPANLWSLRRSTGRELSDVFAPPRGAVHGIPNIARLPKPRSTYATQPRYPVRTASAVIVADGEAVSTDSRVRQAVHFSPVDGEFTKTP